MAASALVFGSIGTLAETSDLQRRAYNHAFAQVGLDWVWDPQTYADLIREPGGMARIARYAQTKGQRVDPVPVHAAKVSHFGRLLRLEGVLSRNGVCQILAAARRRGVRTAIASTTGADQLRLLLDALSPHIGAADFNWIGDASHAARPKPAADIYRMALAVLDVPPARVVAIEDTPEAAKAAQAAGVRVIAFPGHAAQERDFPQGMLAVDRLQPRLLDMGLPTAAHAAE